MKTNGHPGHDRLIDFVEGELGPETDREIEAHVAGCEVCRAYVRSLRSAFAALDTDPVPEPPDTFFTYLAGRARARAGQGRRRVAMKFLPGLASALAAVVLMWWLSGTSFAPVDSVDIIMANMTTGQIVEAVSEDPEVGSLLVEDSEARLRDIETYLLETESIHDLLDNMSETEMERFTAFLEESMAGERETSGLMKGSTRKEC